MFSITDGIAVAALAVSVLSLVWTWRTRRAEQIAAKMGAYFQWLENPAKVRTKNGSLKTAGYHLVLHNTGENSAREVRMSVEGVMQDGSAAPVTLVDVYPQEFPLVALDPGAQYPIPWVLSTADEPFFEQRLFRVRLSWKDGRGEQSRTLPLRRGNIRL